MIMVLAPHKNVKPQKAAKAAKDEAAEPPADA
jgi:translation initiation factor IF-3